jgi:hypothetical protein
MKYLLTLAALGCLTVATAARAEESCNVAADKMMSRDAITKSLHDRGYTQIRGLSTHNGCYEAKGIDSKGTRFELELNGSTGAIVAQE